MTKLPAMALIELNSIAAGAYAADRMVKRSPVELLHAGTVQPGKYLILIGGGTAEVEESYREAIQTAEAAILDEVFLPQVHRQVVEALEGIQRGVADIKAGRTKPALQVFDRLRRKHGISR